MMKLEILCSKHVWCAIYFHPSLSSIYAFFFESTFPIWVEVHSRVTGFWWNRLHLLMMQGLTEGNSYGSSMPKIHSSPHRYTFLVKPNSFSIPSSFLFFLLKCCWDSVPFKVFFPLLLLYPANFDSLNITSKLTLFSGVTQMDM